MVKEYIAETKEFQSKNKLINKASILRKKKSKTSTDRDI